ncbi:hypothetical protein KRP22_015100 [Phytophthora ramorum]|nr:hypothetical protein KRP22_15033 [Phytophthora ramorum]
MRSQQQSSTTFVYQNKLELGEGVDHNGITVGGWSNGFFNCCDDMIPNGLMAFCCPVISWLRSLFASDLRTTRSPRGTYAALYLWDW